MCHPQFWPLYLFALDVAVILSSENYGKTWFLFMLLMAAGAHIQRNTTFFTLVFGLCSCGVSERLFVIMVDNG